MYMARSHGRPPSAGFATQARNFRAATALAARRACIPATAPGERACVWIYLAGHTHYDPDGWTLAGKWIVDGLADAKVVRSDRKDVYAVGGRVLQTDEETRAFILARDDLRRFLSAGLVVGAVVEIARGAL